MDLLQKLLDTELVPEKDVYMKRFDANFRIRAIDGKLIARTREQATHGKELDQEKFGALIIVNGCVSPDWTNEKLRDKFGPTPIDVVQKRLLAGEIAKLSSEILDLSGFGDEDEEIEEVKN